MPSTDTKTFRERLIAREHLVGTFIKTPTVHSTEIIGRLGFDFVVIDEEHSPFDRLSVDAALLAAQAVGTAGLVRVANGDAHHLLNVLDCGASGVLVPHVATPEKARAVASACRYRGGSRGYSGSPRSAGYGSSKMTDYIKDADRKVAVIAQIEDLEALDHLDEIAAVEGIDALFIGRGDLSCAMNAPANDAPEVRAAVEKIARAAINAGKPVCVFVGGLPEATWLKDMGASLFVVSSDQGFMRQAAQRALSEIGALSTTTVPKG